ncbi:MAG TPA: hypothetical protein VLS49_08000 [Usitatibacter sp.]|nr:hypothetical protein [Usitatibacter sp.]
MFRARAFLGCVVLFLASAVAQASALPGADELERSLKLDPAQKAQFDIAVGATQRALLSLALGGLELKERIAMELEKPHPDLGEIARAQERIVDQSRPLFREARREWEKLYAMLDPQQVRMAREYVEEKLGRLERLGESLQALLDKAFRR